MHAIGVAVGAALDAVYTVAERFPQVDVAVQFAGAARMPLLEDAARVGAWYYPGSISV